MAIFKTPSGFRAISDDELPDIVLPDTYTRVEGKEALEVAQKDAAEAIPALDNNGPIMGAAEVGKVAPTLAKSVLVQSEKELAAIAKLRGPDKPSKGSVPAPA